MNLRRFYAWKNPLTRLVLLVATVAAVSSCNDKSESEPEESQGPLEIAGTYTDEFTTDHTITSQTWSDSFANVFHVLSYSNPNNYLIAENDSANTFNPDLFSRFDWKMFNGDLYYCQTAYDAATAAAARAKQADSTDPTAGGCDVVSDFPWTNLTP